MMNKSTLFHHHHHKAYVLLLNQVVALLFTFCFLTPSTTFVRLQEVSDSEFADIFEYADDEIEEELNLVNSRSQVPKQQQQQEQQLTTPAPVNIRPNSKEDRDGGGGGDSDADGFVEDDIEFEILKEDDIDQSPKSREAGNKPEAGLKITNIPLHLRANWESYYLEFAMAFCLALYFINFANGRSKNYTISQAWFEKNLELLEYNFCLVGDDGKKEIENAGLLKESESVYTLWCSGRTSLEGMLVEIRLLKRQDLFSMIMNFFRPTNDKIIIKANLNADVLDNFVFFIATRKTASKLVKEMSDLATFCPERKSPEKYGVQSDNYVLHNEIGEAASFILDAKVTSLLNKNDDLLDYLHVSDQYSGPRINDDTMQVTRLPEVRKVLIAGFNLPANTIKDPDQLERTKPLLQMVFYLVDKLKRFRLGRESKMKSERNRQKVEKLFLQSTHQARQELAQQKREEKRRAEKERMLQESDPEKQRRWEEKEYKRELKRKTPKMKQLKVKAM